MILYYLKTIFTDFRKSGLVTVFNLLGMSVSFAAFMLLSIYVWNEFTYDRYNENCERIYGLRLIAEEPGNTRVSTTLPNPMADLILENIPEMENLCSSTFGPNIFSKESDPINGIKLKTIAVDSSFADIFSIRIKSGSQFPLKGKKKIIISEKAANRIFGNEDPVGKTLLANFNEPYVVDGVFYDMPNNSSFKSEAFCSFPTDNWVHDWSEWSFRHYYLVSSGAEFDIISDKIIEIPAIKEMFEEYPGIDISFKFLPLEELHFDKEEGSGNLMFSQSMVLVAILLLIMAFINYLNFAVANAPKMIKSVNMKNIMGESKRNLFLLLISESVILMIASFLIGLFVCTITIAFWQDIFGYILVLSNHTLLILMCLVLFVVLGALAAIFPSRLIIGVNPTLAIKGLMTFSAKNWISGKVLTVIQYAISIILVTSVLFIEKQISFVKNYELGFEKENILVVNTTIDIRKQEDAFVEELLKNPNITDYAFSQFIPGGVGMGWGRLIDGKQVNFKCWPVDERYLDFMGFDIIEGRKFSENIDADENNFIFNKKAIDEFGWHESALGKGIPGFSFEGELVGIVDDIKYASLHEEVQPMAFWLTKLRHNKLSLKIQNNNVAATIDYIRGVYEKFEDNYSMTYNFLDDSLNEQYKGEEKQAQLILIFCIISIFISVIGALGLIIFMCEFRVKEIGIRKVNGASVFEIVKMLNRSFFMWILIAYVIATPVSYYLIKSWLENFAYKTSVSWWVFAIAGLLTIMVSILTISWQSWKTAIKNPVDAIRNE
jgi:putative ABC transport system permease protein